MAGELVEHDFNKHVALLRPTHKIGHSGDVILVRATLQNLGPFIDRVVPTLDSYFFSRWMEQHSRSLR